MIGKLTGTLDSIAGDAALIDVNGVGYVVHAASRTLSKLGPNGAPVSLLIETHVREDAINLYGFWDATERDWFRLLTTVQGVGAKVALAILSVLAPDDLSLAIAAQDKAIVTRAPGVGPEAGAAHRLRAEGQGRQHRARRRRGDAGRRGQRQRQGVRRPGGGCDLGPGQSRLSPRRGLRRGRQGGARSRRTREPRCADPRRA